MSPLRFAVLLFALCTTGPPWILAADGSAETPFPRPAALVPAIDFWTRVYTEIDTASGYIHDDRHLEIRYQILYLNPAAPPPAQSRSIDKTVEEYRQALLTLAGGKRQGLTVVERQALAPWGATAAEKTLRQAAERLRFQRGQADRFQQGLARSVRWKARIEQIFRSRGLPTELVALPHVESSYHPDALSKAGAAGLWQFMPATARRYLRVDNAVDERLDPYKSSEAAAHLLQHNHSVLRSWPLAITAYNHGLSGVRRAVRETGSEALEEIVRTYENPRFGFASRNFYAAFLAALDVSRHPARHFPNAPQGDDTPVILVMPAHLPADVVIEAFNISKNQLRRLNPSLHHGVWNGTYFIAKDHELKLPGHVDPVAAEALLAQLAEHFGFSAQLSYRHYEVRLGDSLSHIALAHNTTIGKLLRMNRLRSADQIRAGQLLRVPPGTAPAPLGKGAAALLAGGYVAGGSANDAVPADLPQLIAVATGRELTATDSTGTQRALDLGADRCTQAGSPGPALDPGRAAGAEVTLADSPVQPQPDLAADPVDYGVAGDGTIEIQIDETLGHYADWLGMRSDRLRKLNKFRHEQPLIVGRRLALDFSRTTPARFEQQRIAYHQSRQLAYFARYHIAGVRQHAITEGDNLWLLAVQQYGIPLWLLRQYNPDINVDTVLPLDSVIYVPVVEESPEQQDCLHAETEIRSEGDA